MDLYIIIIINVYNGVVNKRQIIVLYRISIYVGILHIAIVGV